MSILLKAAQNVVVHGSEFSVAQALIVLCSLYFSVTFFLFCGSTLYTVSFISALFACSVFSALLSAALPFILSFVSSQASFFLIIRCLLPLFCFHRSFLPLPLLFCLLSKPNLSLSFKICLFLCPIHSSRSLIKAESMIIYAKDSIRDQDNFMVGCKGNPSSQQLSVR